MDIREASDKDNNSPCRSPIAAQSKKCFIFQILELNGQKVAAMAQNSDGSDMNFMPFANDDYQLLPGHADGYVDSFYETFVVILISRHRSMVFLFHCPWSR